MSRHITEHQDIVRPEWIDSNGHMNLAYYVVLFDLATDRLYDALGIGNAYREATGFSCFTAETHTLYEQELMAGERVLIRTYLLGTDAKRLHYFHEMFPHESAAASTQRAAAQELLALHIDMGVRRVTSFPAGRQEALRRALSTHHGPPPRGAGRRIALPESVKE
jgi:acyl-CoA thioester hydrolase